MKRPLLFLILLFGFLSDSRAQSQVLSVLAPGAPVENSGQITSSIVGTRGTATAFYWVVPVFGAGRAGFGSPQFVGQIPNTLSGGNYVALSWNPIAGATGYDVLKSSTASISPPCTCSIATNTTATSVNDTGSTSSYSAQTIIRPGSGTVFLDNLTYSPPVLSLAVNGGASVPILYAPFGTSGYVLTSTGTGSEPTFQAPATSGTVTSVAETFTGGIVSVAGSPITGAGTLALTVAGTSGGIPYFSGATTWASSAALTANLPVIGGGAGVAPSVGTRSGNTTAYVTTTGTQTSQDCVKIDANGNHVANGAACATATTPGGSSTEIQYRAGASTFGGIDTWNYDSTYHSINLSLVDGNSSPSGSLTLALAGAGSGNVDNGYHCYYFAYQVGFTGIGYPGGGQSITVVDNTMDGQVNISDIPVSSDPRVNARVIFRGPAGACNTIDLKVVDTIFDNTTTTYTDNKADSSLTAKPAYYNQANATGYINARGFPTGLLFTDNGPALLDTWWTSDVPGVMYVNNVGNGRILPTGTGALINNGSGTLSWGYFRANGALDPLACTAATLAATLVNNGDVCMCTDCQPTSAVNDVCTGGGTYWLAYQTAGGAVCR